MGIGRWLNVDTVCCGRHRVGSLSSRKMFRVPEIFIGKVMGSFGGCWGVASESR